MKLQNISLSFSTDVIYDDVSLYIPNMEKVGVVGVNGAGKSTFFNVLLGKQELDSGKVSLNNQRIGWLPQVIDDELFDMNQTVFDYLLEGRPIKKLETELQECYEKLSTALESDYDAIYASIEKIQKRLEYYEHYSAENTLLKIISGFHIKDEVLDSPLSYLSGGEKSKVAFARILYANPEILLLDEPTNHMDLETKDYIIQFLKNYKGSVYVISHDVTFLNAICSSILYIDKQTKKMDLFKGDYDTFKKLYEARELTKLREYEIQTKEEEKLKAIVLKYEHGNGKRKIMAQDREKKLAKLQANKIMITPKAKTAIISMEISRESNKLPIEVRNLSFGYDSSPIIQDLSFELVKSEKFLIVGENGVGKSTLLKLIVGELTPNGGEVHYGPKTDIAYYAQEHESLDLDKNMLEQFRDTDLSPTQIRKILGRFLFTGDTVYKRVGVLSPGERARIALAKLTTKSANVLILDEPTNHLDPETQKIVAEVLKTFKGTMLVVSHNPEFVNYLGIERMLVLPEGSIIDYDEELIYHFKQLNEKK